MFIILALIRGHFCVYASVRVELQLFICSSTALFGLEFAVTSPQVQECCPRVGSVCRQSVGSRQSSSTGLLFQATSIVTPGSFLWAARAQTYTC